MLHVLLAFRRLPLKAKRSNLLFVFLVKSHNNEPCYIPKACEKERNIILRHESSYLAQDYSSFSLFLLLRFFSTSEAFWSHLMLLKEKSQISTLRLDREVFPAKRFRDIQVTGSCDAHVAAFKDTYFCNMGTERPKRDSFIRVWCESFYCFFFFFGDYY